MANLSRNNKSIFDKVNKDIKPIERPIPQLKTNKRPTRQDQIFEKAAAIDRVVASQDPTPTPTPSVTPTITPTPSITPTITPTSTVTPTPTGTPAASVTPTPSVTPTITPTNTVTPTITPTPTPTVSDDGYDLYALRLEVAGTAQENPPFNNKYRFYYTYVDSGYVNDLATAEVFLGSNNTVTGRINHGDDITLIITRVSPDDTTSAAGNIEVSVTTSPGSITSPAGKSTNYNFNSGTTIDGGSAWTWTITGAGEPTELEIVVTEGT